VARAARDDFADDVSFVSLDAVDDPALVAAAIAAPLAEPGQFAMHPAVSRGRVPPASRVTRSLISRPAGRPRRFG